MTLHNLSKYALMMLAVLAIGLTGCNDDDDDDNGDPAEGVYTTEGNTTTVLGTAEGVAPESTSYTWTSDQEWLLDGFVFVNSGDTLVIEPGTVIRGKETPTNGDNASALIVANGGYIDARGTASNPIIFTAENDDLANAQDDYTIGRGVWGGVIILGDASINAAGGELNIEGIPTEESRGLFGGTNDNHNAGFFQYASIRHGGKEIGAGNEINGLTMGGVGSGTTIDHVEVIWNQDDAFEWFGGTVDGKYLAGVFCGDDGFDYDNGWRGRGQYFLSLNESTDGGHGGEHDGGTDPETGQPYSAPVIYNATYVGRGLNVSDKFVTYFRDNAGGQYWNSVFMEFPAGINIEDLPGESSRDRLAAGDLALAGNVFYRVKSTDASDTVIAFLDGDGNMVKADSDSLTQAMLNSGNIIATSSPVTGYTAGVGADQVSLTAAPANDATSANQLPNDPFFDQADYRGAFGPNDNWMGTWSFAGANGIVQ